MRRVDAREHTSLLNGADRREIEAGFKRPVQTPGDPNVLVATPTLEMGIDIGDLSTVMLASLPDSVAKYQQRVGRGGRLTGSSLSLAYVTGRGENLPRLGDPLSLVNGAVRPPSTYLDAEEILQRQFLASVIDRMVRDGYPDMPRNAGDALRSAEPGTLLGDLIGRIRDDGTTLLSAFTSTFHEHDTAGLDALRAWVLGTGTPDEEGAVRSAEATIVNAVGEHTREVEALTRRRREVEDAIPELRERADMTAATEGDKRALRSAIAGSKLLKKALNEMTTEAHWVGGLEMRGLLPNYSLMDDSVQLDAHVSWIDPETQLFESEPMIVDRGSSRALTELAPGAHFYAHRLEMRVDGAELGQENADVQTHVACDTCGYVDVLDSPTAPSPRACPRCGSQGIVEAGQRFEAARLTRVYSDVRRDDALIGDDSDERTRTRYEIVPAVDFDPTRLVDQWSVEAAALGVAHYRRLTVRWFNVGRDGRHADTMEFAGRPVAAQLFRLCEACGHLDSGSGVNKPQEHRAWCRYRRDPGEHVISIALSRSLVTQGVAISLPEGVVGDMHSVESLAAALQLGLREVLGGAPAHLSVQTVPHPAGSADGAVRSALFIHDTVPGGTGYLTELATPRTLWTVLVRAAQVLDNCPCGEEGRGSCHRCLAPFGRDVFRVDALRALKELLLVRDGAVADLDPDQCGWDVSHTAIAAGSGESPLEQRFRATLAERLKELGRVTTSPTPNGTALNIATTGGRPWRLEPQVDVAGVRPDFILSAPGTPRIAVFTDGHAYHASAHNNRIADDATKRETLRADGYRVIAVTHQDLENPVAPAWLNSGMLKVLMTLPAGKPGSGISSSAAAEYSAGPLGLLEGIVNDPDSTPRGRLADALPLLLGAQSDSNSQGLIAADDDLVDIACAALVDAPASGAGEHTLLLYRRPWLVLAARMKDTATHEIALVLDDSADAVADPEHAAAWREWLQLSNVLALSTISHSITTLGARQGPPLRTQVDVVLADSALSVEVAPGTLPGGWADLDLAYTEDVVVELAGLLAHADAPVPEAGADLDSNVPAELSWHDARVAVVYSDMPHDEIQLLRNAGWTVHPATGNATELAQAVQNSLSARTEE